MRTRILIFVSILMPLLPSPVRAQEAPVATAPIPPAVKGAPDTPLVVPTNRRGPAKPHAAATAEPGKPQRQAAAAHQAPKPAPRAKDADRKTDNAAHKTTKAEKKPELKQVAKADTRARPPATHRRVVEQRRWIVREERRLVPPPPPFGPSWYAGPVVRGPMAYGPYGGGMRVPPPMSWDE